MPTSAQQVKSYANPALRRRRVTFFAFVTTVVVGGTAVFTSIFYPGFAIADAVEVVTPAATMPAPALLRGPLERIGEQTALVKALPDKVGKWVQAGISGFMDWQNDDAVEAWTVNYLDGTAAPDAAVAPAAIQLTVAQWDTPANAALFFRGQTRDIENPVMTGDVTLADNAQVAGQYVLATDPETGIGVMWWRNGTVVIKAVGPVDLLPDFYSIYPL